MSSTKVDVTVTTEGATVEVLKGRPVRLTPAGEAGVVYAAEVFPLYEGNVIRLEDGRFEKSACYQFVEPGGPIPYAQRRATGPKAVVVEKWNVIKNQFGVYLVFDADEDSAQAVVDLMDEVGLGVKRWDASVRPSEDGEWYDWFIRLQYTGTKEAAYSQVKSAFAAAAPASTIQPPTHRRSDLAELTEMRQRVTALEADRLRLQVQVQGLSATADRWKSSLEEAQTRLEITAGELAQTRKSERSLARELNAESRRRAAAEAELGALRSAREQLEQQAARSDEAALNALQDMANQLINQADAERDTAKVAAERAEAEATELRATVQRQHQELAENTLAIDRLRTELAELQTHLDEMENAEQETLQLRKADTNRLSSGRRVSVDAFLSRALPRMVISQAGVDCLLELKDPSEVLYALMQLNLGVNIPAFPYGATKSRTTPIQEVKEHFNIGKDGKASDMGRVYYHRAGSQLLVLVHQKQNDAEQARTVKSFSKWCSTFLRAGTS